MFARCSLHRSSSRATGLCLDCAERQAAEEAEGLSETARQRQRLEPCQDAPRAAREAVGSGIIDTAAIERLATQRLRELLGSGVETPAERQRKLSYWLAGLWNCESTS